MINLTIYPQGDDGVELEIDGQYDTFRWGENTVIVSNIFIKLGEAIIVSNIISVTKYSIIIVILNCCIFIV